MLYKRLYLLNSIAIVFVVVGHAASLLNEQTWVTGAHGQFGNLAYIIVTGVTPLWNFAVPAFFFVNGFFTAFTNRGKNVGHSIKSVNLRVINLLVPLIFWFSFIFLADFLTFVLKHYLLFPQSRETLFHYFSDFIPYFTLPDYYYFIPLLCIFSLAGIWLAPLVIKKGSLVLSCIAAFYVGLYILRWLDVTQILIINIPYLGSVSQWYPGNWTAGWVFYVALGIYIGYYSEKVIPWLKRNRHLIILMAGLFAIIAIIERIYYLNYGLPAEHPRLSEMIYSLFFILGFLLIPLEKLKISKQLLWLNSRVYGIYLTHLIVLDYLGRAVNHFLPPLGVYYILLQPVFIVVGLGVPLLLIEAVARSPLRKYHRFLFG